MIDISLPMSSDTAFPLGRPAPAVRPISEVEGASAFRVCALESWTTHSGTHLDAPRHVFRDGMTLEEMPVDRFHGPAIVIDVGDAHAVQVEHLDGRQIEGMNVLFRTRNSRAALGARVRRPVTLSLDAIDALVRMRPNLVGIDHFSVDRVGDAAYPAHRSLLGAGILILEALRLDHAPAGRYELFAHPLAIAGADGSPVRALLRARPVR